MNTTTKREQVEAVLKARGMKEVAPGDWEGRGDTVRLDLREGPELAWLNPAGDSRKEKVSYDDVIRLFG